MALFRRSRREDPDVERSDPADGADDSLSPESTDPETADLADLDPSDQPEPGRPDRADGPWDRDEVESVEGLMDFGSLLIPPREGMQLHLELDPSEQNIVAVNVVVSGSGIQLQAFAAPRSSGIWPEIRTEIAQSVVGQGGTADIVDGPFGRELIARMPQRGTTGKTVLQPVRFVGVDGPRWFLRAVLSGAAAVDAAQQAPALALVRSVVVSRGEAAMAPRDLLPLSLPPELANPDPPEPPPYEGAHRRDDLRPFERGPEITEIH